MPSHQDGHYSVSRAASLLGVSGVSIWRWMRDGHLPAARLGRRTTRSKRDDLSHVLVQVEPAGPDVRLSSRPGAAPTTSSPAGRSPEHAVQFYETDAFLLERAAEFIGASLRDGGVGIVIASGEHRAGLEARLRERGLDPATIRAGAYCSLGAEATLAELMVDGAPHAGRFAAVVGSVIERASQGGRPVRVFSELVTLLVASGNHRAAVQLEQLWNDLQRRTPFSLLCACPSNLLETGAGATPLTEICAAHGSVIPAESYMAHSDGNDQLQAVVLLQHKAQRLEFEIAQKQAVEERLRASLEAELEARRLAEVAQNLRDEFLSIAAHELRNPLTGLSLNAQLALRQLERNPRLDPEYVEKALGAITSQAAKISRLLDQLLDVSRLQSGKLTLEPHTTDLAPLIAQVVASARARSSKHAFTLEAPPALAAWVDALRVEQVLVNLLDNAIKFSPEGGAIDIVLLQPAPSLAELSVRDRGCGIPVEARGSLFERFHQAHTSGVNQGLGLGLHVSRQIVELHGGKIRAEFPPDGGTRFVVSLPIGAGETLTRSAAG